MGAAQRVMSAAVPWIATNRFLPVRLRAAGGVAVLFEVQADQEQLVIARRSIGLARFRCGGKFAGGYGLRWSIVQEHLALLLQDNFRLNVGAIHGRQRKVLM